MSASNPMLDALRRANPGWAPWLRIVGVVLDEAQSSAWDALVRGVSAHDRGAPMLSRAVIAFDGRIERLFAQLARLAAESGARKLTGLAAVDLSREFARDVFRASLEPDGAALDRLASAGKADPGALRAVASLLPMPFLHACARRWQHTPASAWDQGYCPVCASWPAAAEVCGVERIRWLRCGRCGMAWQSAPLRCTYCGMRDHTQLDSLVVEGQSVSVEVCNRCMGYLKVHMKLQKSAAAAVIVEDLASMALDVAAAQRGYLRPRGGGCALDVSFGEACA